jgi:pancreatic triacylglycerol lipase
LSISYFLVFSPFSPSIINVKFPTFTSKNRNVPKFIDINDPETILEAGINAEASIFVIAHGFLESGDRPWVKNLMNALLDYEKEATGLKIVYSLLKL